MYMLLLSDTWLVYITSLTKSSSVKTKEVVQLETGQPSYPQLAMYQDPSTIERKAAPTTGDLYAQPEKPARHQQQQAMELPTYQDPSTIEHQAAATGDMYALPDKNKIPKQPSGPAPALYTEVGRTNQVSTLFYCSTCMSHSESMYMYCARVTIECPPLCEKLENFWASHMNIEF